MDVLEQAVEILKVAEDKVAALMAQSLQQKDYVAVQWLTGVAQQLAAFEKSSPRALQFQTGVAESLQLNAAQRSVPVWPSSSLGESASENKDFPRFHREQNQLVKIGYSKSDRRTYEHRSPKETLDRLVTVLADLGKRDKLFATEELIAPAEPRMEGIPTYQVYLCLGFLVRHGMVRRHGRAGYKLEGVQPKKLASAVEVAWETLPAR